MEFNFVLKSKRNMRSLCPASVKSSKGCIIAQKLTLRGCHTIKNSVSRMTHRVLVALTTCRSYSCDAAFCESCFPEVKSIRVFPLGQGSRRGAAVCD